MIPKILISSLLLSLAAAIPGCHKEKAAPPKELFLNDVTSIEVETFVYVGGERQKVVTTPDEQKEILSILNASPPTKEGLDAGSATLTMHYKDGSYAIVGVGTDSLQIYKNEFKWVLRNDGSIVPILKSIEARVPTTTSAP